MHILWNNLPLALQQAMSVTGFKILFYTVAAD